MIKRSHTLKWKKDESQTSIFLKGNLSYDKMKAVTLLKHPYKIVKGKPTKIGMCDSTGSLFGFRQKLNALDELGMGVSIYFKLLKCLVHFFILCSIVCMPLYYLYSSGNMSA